MTARCAHRLRTDALASSRQGRHKPTCGKVSDLRPRTIPALRRRCRHDARGTANAVRVYSPSGVQIPEPPLLSSGFSWWTSTGEPLFFCWWTQCAHRLRTSALPTTHHGRAGVGRIRVHWLHSQCAGIATSYARKESRTT
jgi:hypothetical protein